MNRVKYYSLANWSSEDSFIRALELLKHYQADVILSIDDAIEFWNIQKFFDNDARHKDHDDRQHEEFCKTSKRAAKDACTYFSKELRSQGVRTLLQKTDRGYRDDFWELCCATGSLDAITSDDIAYLFENGEIAPRHFFGNRKLVGYFSQTLFSIIKSQPEQYVHMILNDRFVLHEQDHRHLYYPRELTDDELIGLTNTYIASANPHPNDLKIITTVDSKSGFAFPPEVRLAAQRRYEELWMKTREDGSAITFGYGTGAMFRKGQAELVVAEKAGNNFQYYYSWDWVNENRDYLVLLMNFIHLFGYTDRHCRITLFSKESELDIIENLFTTKTKASYMTSTSLSR